MKGNTHKSCSLNIFTRYPHPGSCKTRLIPALGKKGAAELHLKMLRKILFTAFSSTPHCPINIWYSGCDKNQIVSLLGHNTYYFEQIEGDLGLKMLHVFNQLREKNSSVILIGSDCPSISKEILQEAFAALTNHDLVIGPAHDGGYYLMGLNKPYSALFKNIKWGTNSVYKDTLKIANQLQLKIYQLTQLADIDRPEDLKYLDGIIKI